jgi:predicted DNA-binding protein YlxM (UPF0122 family)
LPPPVVALKKIRAKKVAARKIDYQWLYPVMTDYRAYQKAVRDTKKAHIVLCREAGMSMEDIAQEMGVSRQLVYELLRKLQDHPITNKEK